jgi:hypothetical protein
VSPDGEDVGVDGLADGKLLGLLEVYSKLNNGSMVVLVCASGPVFLASLLTKPIVK